MPKFAADLAAARPTGPKGEQKSSVVPELSGQSTGLSGWSHFLPPERELNERWVGRQRIETVEDMLNDSQVTSLRQAIRLPVHRYIIELNPQDCDPVAVDLIATDLDVALVGGAGERRTGRRADRFSSRRHLDRALDALDYGHAVFEQAGRIDDAGYWRLVDLAPVPQWTISDQNSWDIDRHGRVIRVVQWGSNPPVKIPVNHLVTFTWQGKPGDPRGRSMLRPLFGSWVMRDRTMRVMGMSAERTGMGIPVGKVRTGAVVGAKEKMERLLAGLAAGNDTNLVLETDGDIRQELMLMGVTGQTPNLVEMLRYHDESMARAMLAMLIQLGQTQTGSRALGGTFDDLLSMFHDTVVDWYCDAMQKQLVERWIDRNREPVGGEPAPAPLLVWRRRDDEVESEPEPAVDSTVDEVDAPAQLPAPVAARRRSPAPRGRTPVAASAAEPNTGVMVALYPPPSVAAALALDGGEAPEELHLTLAFLGKADDLDEPEALRAAVRVWAAATATITGEVSGVGLFTAGEEPVTYLSLDAPALPAARQALIDALKAADLTPSEQHGFTPHMTLDYADRVGEVDAGGQMLTFGSVAVVIGEERTDYRLGDGEKLDPVSASLAAASPAALSRRQRATRSAFAATVGRDLRRDPTGTELAAAVDFATIEQQYVATQANVAAALVAIRDDLTAVAVEQVAGMAEVEPLTLGDTLAAILEAHARAQDDGPLVALLVALAIAGVNQVVGEAARQGVELATSTDYQARAEADATDLMRRMARQVAESSASAARTGVPSGMAGGPASLVIAEHLGSLTSAAAEQAAAGASSRAQNAGRVAAIAAGSLTALAASEVLDQATCGPCLLADGREYPSLTVALAEYPAGGYVACEGMERCRGMLVAVFAIEPETESAGLPLQAG